MRFFFTQFFGVANGRKNPRRIWTNLLLIVVLLCGAGIFITFQHSQPAAAAGAYNWTQFDGNPQHSGNNTQESTISSGNVGSLQLLFRVSLPSVADGAPVYLGGVGTGSGTRDLVFVTTTDGHIVALDAHSGTQIWSQQVGPGSCHINNGGTLCYTTSSPAIDPNGQYVYSYGLDGFVHKYQIGNGTEVRGGGWPELTTTKPYDEKGSPAISVVIARSGTSYLYMANGGYPGDQGDYQGHITAINLSNGAQNVFNTLCSNQTVHFVENGSPDCSQKQSAVWARPDVTYNPGNDKIYITTGNGDYNPGAHDWGDSVLELNPDGTGTNGGPLDSYTPTNFAFLQANDQDLGSTNPALLPGNLAVQSGKDGELRVINLNNLSGQGGPGHTGGELSITNVPQGNEVLTQPAVWTNPGDNSTWVFVANDNGISGLQLNGNSLQARWQINTGGTSPFIANNVLYYLTNTGARALNPTNGAVLWQDNESNLALHWESPIVDNGVLYYTDGNGHLSAFAPSGNPPPANASLVSHWALDEGSGTTANDSSGHGNTGTLQPGAGWTGGGRVGPNALNLNGASNSYVDVPSPVVDTSNSYSVAAWVKLNDTNGYHTAVSIDGSAISGFFLQYSSQFGTFSFNAHSSDSTSAPQTSANATIGSPVPGQWYHLVGVYDGNAHQLLLYVNGQLQSTQSFTSAWHASGHTAIGRALWGGNPTDFWSGQIDDVRFYSGALSGADVAALAAQTAYWTFDEGNGTTANDSSGNGNTGTLQPGAGWTGGGRVGPNALNLNGGSNSYVDVPRTVVDTSNSYSVAAWVKLNNTNTYHTAVSIDGSNISGFYLQYCAACGTFSFNAHTSDSTSAPQVSANATIGTPVLGQWYHLVGVYDAGAHQLRLYVNGQLQGTQAFTSAWHAGGHTAIGRALWGGNPVDFWPGQIDDVRFYNSVLSQDAISMLAQG